MNIQSAICYSLFILSCSAVTDKEPVPADDIQPLTCALIAGPNCWSEAKAMVASCAPKGTGVLTADNTRCTYASGAVVRSAWPLTTLGEEEMIDFELDVGGSVCAYYQERESETGGDTRSLSTSLGTVTWTFDDEISLTCPDGSRYAASLFDLECDGFFSSVGWVRTFSPTSVAFRFLQPPIEVFDCAQP